MDDVGDQPLLGLGLAQGVLPESAADREHAGVGGVEVAEEVPQPGCGVGGVAERDTDPLADVGALQVGGDVDPGEVGAAGGEQVVVMGEDLFLGRGHDAVVDEGDFGTDPGEDGFDEAAGDAVRLE